ncbi:TPA: NAD(P)/FAD-dependent oxidoreductase [Acinetobacter baumannii]|nr:NAD(P)/FAD-dependent oxidoreductase [Acinetobacter baumannii]
MTQNLHHIVIVGGGAGGLELATQLGETFGKNGKAKITLVDQNLTHIWKPLLHEIAAGSLNPHEEQTNYFAHAEKHHYEFVLGTLTAVNKDKKIIDLIPPQVSKEQNTHIQQLSYDTLVLALGSVSNDFNTPGVRENCHFLDSRKQADIFQQDLLHLYIEAQNQADQRTLNIGIIGAGATGVELAAELIETTKNFYRYGLKKIHPNQVKITLIEASERILPALSEKTAEHSAKQLQKMGVEILTKHRVEKIDEHCIYFSNGKQLNSDITVWAAGVKAPKVLESLSDFERDNINRLMVYATLQTYSDPNVFAFGDCAHCQLDARHPPLGPRAQVASQQASFLVDAMAARLNGRSQPMFTFNDKGSLVSLSRNKAVGELLGDVSVQGYIAKTMYVSLYRLHQATIHGYTQAGLLTMKDLLTRRVRPKIKLY